MRYWDASAIAPLVVSEETSELARSWLAEDPSIVTWAWTRVELMSAVERRVREGTVSRAERRLVVDRLGLLWKAWDEVTDLVTVRTKAIPILARHPVRAADAAQLGAALVVAEHVPEGLTFVCLDRRLNEAAEKEGLRTLPAPGDGTERLRGRPGVESTVKEGTEARKGRGGGGPDGR